MNATRLRSAGSSENGEAWIIRHASKLLLVAFDETKARFYGGVHECHRGQQRLHVGDLLHVRLAALVPREHVLLQPQIYVDQSLHRAVVARGGEAPDPGQVRIRRLLLATHRRGEVDALAQLVRRAAASRALEPPQLREQGPEVGDQDLDGRADDPEAAAVEGPGAREEGVVAVAHVLLFHDVRARVTATPEEFKRGGGKQQGRRLLPLRLQGTEKEPLPVAVP